MGCDASKDQLPILLCFFETGNEQQKQYCIKLKDNFQHQKAIRFEIKSTPGVNFCIQLKYKDKLNKIQTVFNDGEDEMKESLNKMYKILDEDKDNNN